MFQSFGATADEIQSNWEAITDAASQKAQILFNPWTNGKTVERDEPPDQNTCYDFLWPLDVTTGPGTSFLVNEADLNDMESLDIQAICDSYWSNARTNWILTYPNDVQPSTPVTPTPTLPTLPAPTPRSPASPGVAPPAASAAPSSSMPYWAPYAAGAAGLLLLLWVVDS